jgi:hypothetical protein
MPNRTRKLFLLCALAVAFPCASFAADQEIPARPAPAKPATEKPFSNIFRQRELSGSTAACAEWTDGCRTCQRSGPDAFTCSNVGIACVQTAGRCTRSNPQ